MTIKIEISCPNCGLSKKKAEVPIWLEELPRQPGQSSLELSVRCDVSPLQGLALRCEFCGLPLVPKLIA